MSLTFGDIKDRIIFVDYPPGVHGTFVSYVINNLIYGTKNNNPTPSNLNNYHGHGGTPPVIYQLDILEKDIRTAVVPLDNLGLDSFQGNLPIAWPIHWSNNLTNKGRSLDKFRVIEIYAGPASVYRHLVNMMVNIGHSNATDPEYFITNFYKIITNIKYNHLLDDLTILSPDTYNFSEVEVVDILEKEIYNKHSNKYDTLAGIPCRKLIPHEQTFSIEVSLLYNYHSFLQCIRGINELFRLNINIDEESLRVTWQEFIDKQWVIDLTKEKLHPLDRAYKNFLQKCQ